ncbi:MAG: hypothetical protein JXA42_08315 [Anaerolineales bacterium]|nr:hypothetical protein [Anaerolineales bacterium]
MNAIGTTADPAVVNPAQDATLIALLKGLLQQFVTPSGITIQRAAISASSSGDNTLVAAVTAKKIKVVSMKLIVSGDVDIRFESGTGGAALTGVMSLAQDGNGFVLPAALPGFHWFETGAGQLLNLELSVAVQVSGCLTYYTEA